MINPDGGTGTRLLGTEGSALTTSAVRFSGDSGDGMQIVGEQFATAAALSGAFLQTFPDYPSEIRAPAGTLPGVSAFQVHFGSKNVTTPGDSLDMLVAMNPAALKMNVPDLSEGGILIVNSGAFTEENITKAGYGQSPLAGLVDKGDYRLLAVDMNQETLRALEQLELRSSDKLRCRNFFALGLVLGLYSLTIDYPRAWVRRKWETKPLLVEANRSALEAGYRFAASTGEAITPIRVERATLNDGVYRKISGNEAIALGLIAGSERCWREIVYGGYPITPATSIFEELARQRNFLVKTVQAEDEISAIGTAIGASYAGRLGVTATSGPGLCLMSEALGLAVMTELPLVVVDVMRAGPSTGLPTKAEQADLFLALFGRHGEAPVPVLAARSPSDCFWTAFESVRIAIMCRTPVVVLSDSSVGNGSEQWQVPNADNLPEIEIDPMKRGEPYKPYERDPLTHARRLGLPGRASFEHRIGGLEKDQTGQISQDPANHELMVRMRDLKVRAVTRFIPKTEIFGNTEGRLLVLGWGGTFGAISLAVQRKQAEGVPVSHVHLRYLNPLPSDLEGILKRFDRVLVPEMNLGQMALVLRATYLREFVTMAKMQGRPFKVCDIEEKIAELL